jgi:hypothetical protein
MTQQPPAGFDRTIADYYERAPEESRLEHGAFQLEQARTRELIERHAPPAPAEVLDVGGAAGAYARRDGPCATSRHRLARAAPRRSASALSVTASTASSLTSGGRRHDLAGGPASRAHIQLGAWTGIATVGQAIAVAVDGARAGSRALR